MGKPRKVSNPELKCLVCDKATKGLAVCSSCRKMVRESGFNPAVFCKLCRTIRAICKEDQRELTRLATPRTPDQQVLVHYDAEAGCPQCLLREGHDFAEPHGMVYRMTAPNKEAS